MRKVRHTSRIEEAYFHSIEGGTPPRWSDPSLISFPDCSDSFRRLCIIDTNCFDGFQQSRCWLSRLGELAHDF